MSECCHTSIELLRNGRIQKTDGRKQEVIWGWVFKLCAMNLTSRMKKILFALAAAAFLAAPPSSQALNYLPGRLLLVFRADGFSDFEIDLGPVSSFVGVAAGTKVPVAYDTNAVKANFNNSLGGVKFSLAAATALGDSNPRIWLGDLNLTTTPKDVTLSKFSTIRGKIEAAGAQAAAITSSNAAPYVVSPTDVNSFSYIVSGGTGGNVGTMNGDAPFAIDPANPTTLKFYELHISNAATKPDATFLGGFTIDVSGALYFTAGQLPALAQSNISVARTGNSSSVSFTTQMGANYRLLYATDLLGAWTQTGSKIAGTGASLNITDSSSDAVRFYQIQTVY